MIKSVVFCIERRLFAANLRCSRPLASIKALRNYAVVTALALTMTPAASWAQGSPPPTFVVNTTADDATGTASNCTGSPEGTCTLRDALAAAGIVAASNINFNPTVFLATNSAAGNTITLSNGTLNIPSNTTITGPTTGSGATLTNLVTLNGNDSYTVFTVASGVSGSSIANLGITNGIGLGSNGAGITNAGTLTVSGSTFSNDVGNGGGGIGNTGTLTVTGSTFSNNYCASGGGIANSGTLTVTDSTIFGNSAGEGGGIYSTGTLTVSSSTIASNIAQFSGGGIYTGGGTATVTGSTISNNSASPGNGSGIGQWLGTLALANTILDGNGLDGGHDDLRSGALYPVTPVSSVSDCSGVDLCNAGGNIVGYVNGSPASTQGSISLALLSNYGGPTQTMIPLPGSRSICSGLAAGIPAGVTTDQRGYPIKNTTYPGYTSSTPCVDSGAVQSNYAIKFSTEPPSSAVGSVALNPAPVVSLIESGALVAVNGGTVAMTDTASLLTGTLSEAIKSGAATFGNLAIGQSTTDDVLIATLPLNPSINLTAQASTGIDATLIPATLSPSSGTLSSSQTFNWDDGVGPPIFQLLLGTSGPGSVNLYNLTPTKATTATVAIPSNGVTVYATLYQLIDGTWQATRYTFSEPGTPTPATLMPSSGTLSTSQTFTWNNGSGPALYQLLLGTIGPGSSDLYNLTPSKATSATLSIPSKGVTVFATLYQLVNGTWQVSSYTFQESGTKRLATLTPSSGKLSASQTFTWNNGSGPDAYELWLGTKGPGSSNLYNPGEMKTTSATVSIPSNGVKVNATLWQLIDGAWQATHYTFSEP